MLNIHTSIDIYTQKYGGEETDLACCREVEHGGR